MKIKSVAVLGAGAVGSYVIWGLSEKSDIRLGVIAEGERAERLKKNGCAINGKIYHPEVWTPDEAHDVDLMVVALKYGSLEGALESIQKATGEHTAIMSLMNGVDSEEIIGRAVGMEHVLPALIKVASHKEEDGYHFDPPTTLGIIFGEPSAPFDSERVKAVEELFPNAERVSSYGTAQDILRKSEEELKALAAAGLGIIYMGAETGDDEILKYINKGVTSAEIIAAGQKLKRCGLQSSITLISGLGGRGKVKEHARSCARLISAINPEYASFLTLRLYEGTPMYDDVVSGRFERITPDEIIDEMTEFLQNVDSPGTVFRTNHASNYVVLKGDFNRDIPAMLKQLEQVKKNKNYRVFRETGDLL